MKRGRIFQSIMAVLAAIMLTGCGATPMIELTSEEEDIITLYSAKVVAKHNVRLAQGLVRFKGSDEEPEPEEPAEEDPLAGDAALESGPDSDIAGAEGEESAGASAAEAGGGTVTLNDLFAGDGLEFTYDKATFEKDYVFNNYYHLTPSDGNDYLILSFTVSNTTDAALDVDLYSLEPKFTAIVDGSAYTSDTTILPNDLATYLTTIEGNATDTAILLFEVPQSASKDVNAVGLQVSVGGTTYNISL